MIDLLIALAVIAMFGLGLLCALGAVRCRASRDHQTGATE
jgi:hypothetical protein